MAAIPVEQHHFAIDAIKHGPISEESNRKENLTLLAPFDGLLKPRHSFLSNLSSTSTDSLASALSKFPATPMSATEAPQLQALSTCNSGQGTREELQRPSSSNSSSAGSQDTLVPGSPALRVASDSLSPEPNGVAPNCYDVSHCERLETNSTLTAHKAGNISSFACHKQLKDQVTAESGHVKHLGDVSEEKSAGTPGASLSCRDLSKKQYFSSINAAKQPQTNLPPLDHLRALTQRFESGLSIFRSSAVELMEELQTQFGDSPSEDHAFLLSSIRRTASQGLEAMIMISWLRETMLDCPNLAKNGANWYHSTQHLQGKAQGMLPSTPAPSISLFPAADTTDPPSGTHSNHRVAEADMPSREGKDTRRNGFESPTRDRSIATHGNVHHGKKHLHPHTANASLSPPLSIEDLAKARSSTPLHFNRPATPYAPSLRRSKLRPATASTARNDVVADPRQVDRTAKARGQSFSSNTRSSAVEAQTMSIRRVPSLHVGNERSNSCQLVPKGREMAVNSEQFVRFPCAGSSPPASPVTTAAGEQSSMIRQPKQSLKSLRNFKISLRAAYKESAFGLNTPTASTPVPIHVDRSQSPSAHSSQTTQRNVSDPVPGSTQSSYVRALIPASQRPHSLVQGGSLINNLPSTKPYGAVKPLTRIRHMTDSNNATPAICSEKEQGERKLSLRSLWRIFSG